MVSNKPFHPWLKSIALAFLAYLLTACGLSKPGTDDIAPFVQERMGSAVCQLWDLTDIRKVDGLQQGDDYRVDFVAKLTFKDEWFKQLQIKSDWGKYNACALAVINRGFNFLQEPGSLATKLDVKGFGVLVKSEQGWRLRGDLDYSLTPVAGAEKAVTWRNFTSKDGVFSAKVPSFGRGECDSDRSYSSSRNTWEEWAKCSFATANADMNVYYIKVPSGTVHADNVDTMLTAEMNDVVSDRDNNVVTSSSNVNVNGVKCKDFTMTMKAVQGERIARICINGEYKIQAIVKPRIGQPIDKAEMAVFVSSVTPKASIVVAAIQASAPQPTTAESCVASKMAVWEKQHEKEIGQAAAAARAKGEEFQMSAGMDAMVRQEALDKATAECR